MKKETALPRIKKIAHTFLMTEIGQTKFSPIVVQHPFTNSGLIAYPNATGHWVCTDITKDEDTLARWRQEVRAQIDRAESVDEIYMKLNKPYCLTFLKFARPHLSEKDFSRLLADAWIRSEYPNDDRNVTPLQLLSMFRSADPSFMMEEEELSEWMALPESVTVYRGVTSDNAGHIRRMSWTLDPKVAEWFARRFGEKGTVYTAQIGKEHIFAFFSSRNEAEVVVDPSHLDQITVFQEVGVVEHSNEDGQDGELKPDMQ